jgi:hypothetical protein
MPRPPDPAASRQTQAARKERRSQIRGLTLLALAILLFSILRAGLGRVFTAGWWRLW